MAFVTAAVALYAEDTRLESPLVRHLLGTERGIVEGRDKLRDFLHIVFERTPPSRRRYRTGFFTDGRRLIWDTRARRLMATRWTLSNRWRSRTG